MHRPVPVPVPVSKAGGLQGLLWASVPFLTGGFGTPFAFVYAGVKRRSWLLGLSGLAYGGGTGIAMALIGAGDGALTYALAAVLLTTLWIVGSAHAAVVHASVFPRMTRSDRLNQQTLELAKRRRTLREESRTLAANDPQMAVELRIGRPDLPRTYDDGGLIDVNHAPPPTLALLPGMTESLVARIVRARQEHGTFISVEELGMQADLPPDLVHRLSEYTIFLP